MARFPPSPSPIFLIALALVTIAAPTAAAGTTVPGDHPPPPGAPSRQVPSDCTNYGVQVVVRYTCGDGPCRNHGIVVWAESPCYGDEPAGACVGAACSDLFDGAAHPSSSDGPGATTANSPCRSPPYGIVQDPLCWSVTFSCYHAEGPVASPGTLLTCPTQRHGGTSWTTWASPRAECWTTDSDFWVCRGFWECMGRDGVAVTIERILSICAGREGSAATDGA